MLKIFLAGYVTCSLCTYLRFMITNDEIQALRYCFFWFLLPLEFIVKVCGNTKPILDFLHENFKVYNLYVNGVHKDNKIIIRNSRIKRWEEWYTEGTRLELAKNQDFDFYTFWRRRDNKREINKMLRDAFDI